MLYIIVVLSTLLPSHYAYVKMCAIPACSVLLYIAKDNYNVLLMAKVVSFQDSSANGSPYVSFCFMLYL